MAKRLALALSSILMLSSAFAQNFYAGVGAGATNYNNRVSINNNQIEFGKPGFIGEIYAGYLFKTTQPYQLGLEIFADHTNVTASVNSLDTDDNGNDENEVLKTHSDYRYGIRFLPGCNFSQNAEFHAIIGYVNGKFKLKIIDPDDGDTSSRFDSNGYQLGFGSSVNLTTNLAIRTDVIYSDFSSTTRLAADNKIRSLDGILSLVYSWDKQATVYK